MSDTVVNFEGAFPASLRDDVRVALQVLPTACSVFDRASAERIEVLVEAEPVMIPYRIYNPVLLGEDMVPLIRVTAASGAYKEVPAGADYTSLSLTQKRILDCLYTRHFVGYERQRRVENVIASGDSWVVPYVVQLLGEYVIEIHRAIRRALAELLSTSERHREAYARFATENPAFVALTRQRATSYWDCYYRRSYPARAEYPALLFPGRSYPDRAEYPALVLLDTIERIAAEGSRRQGEDALPDRRDSTPLP